jgi:hypothetical protein
MALVSGPGSTIFDRVSKSRKHGETETTHFAKEHTSLPISLVDLVVIYLEAREENFVLLLRHCSLSIGCISQVD